MKKALVVGIDYYDSISNLHGCVNDSYSVKNVLERHSDGSLNFSVKHITSTNQETKVLRANLKDLINELFNDDCDIALFYFAGHGYLENTGGYLVTSECRRGDDGLSLNDVLTIVNQSRARSKVIILDSCHSGIAGTFPSLEGKSLLNEGVTILTASSDTQYASEENGKGVFTTLFVDALNGSASNLIGDVTPGSVYAHIDQSLGPWEQRPIFKTNVKSFITLRKVVPPIALSDLKEIVNLFNVANLEYELNPSFEPDSSEPNEENVAKFKILQKYNKINLVVPIDEEHMYYAAINSKSCKLTALGVHYWNLVKKGRI